ncbi:hypothetical protein C8Q76DRAFT_794454 [Earliella scabrosa]|nr:hypothetical protein C8Q76DRAFT_794454 [Earliella scabrosa]
MSVSGLPTLLSRNSFTFTPQPGSTPPLMNSSAGSFGPQPGESTAPATPHPVGMTSPSPQSQSQNSAFRFTAQGLSTQVFAPGSFSSALGQNSTQESYPAFEQPFSSTTPSPTPPPRDPMTANNTAQSAVPDMNPGPRAATAVEKNDVIPPLFVDHIAKDFRLNSNHAARLRALVHLGSVSPALSQADLATRTYIFAAIISLLDDLKQVFAATRTNLDDLPGLFNDMKIRLEDSFKITAEQKGNIRAVIQDLLYQANRIKYKGDDFPQDVEDALKNEQVVLRLNNIFGSPHREKVLQGIIKTVSSSVRNAFRQDLRNSVFGKHPITLSQFTNQTAARFKRGGIGKKGLPTGLTIRNALLRRFALDNPQILNIAETEVDEDTPGSEADPEGGLCVDAQAGPAQKKRKTATTAGGRVPRGQDFWSQVDVYLAGYIIQWGNNITAPEWKTFVDDVIFRDHQNFPDRSYSLPATPATEPTLSNGPFHGAPQSTAPTTSSSSPYYFASLLGGPSSMSN